MAPPEPVPQPRHPDITLVNLITENWDGARWLPTGGLYVVAALEQAGYAVDFRDFQLYAHEDRYHPEILASYFESICTAPILGIGLMIDMLPVTLRAVELLRARRPDVKILLGGPGPSNLHQQILSRYPAVDLIVRGEGEATAVDLLRALHAGADLAGVQGIAYRDGGGVRETPLRERNRHLTDLPQPAYHRVNFQHYHNFGVLFSRGCVFTCEFCEIPFIWQHQVQRRSVDDIVQEMILLRDRYGVERVEILDDLFVSKRGWARAFCEAMVREKVGVKWSCFGYISLMTEDLMEEMAAAGCEGVFYGIESGSDRILEKVGKHFTMAQARDTVLRTLRYMKPAASFIWNYPFESVKDFYDTVTELIFLHHRGSSVRLFMLCPLKPTPFARGYEDQMRFDPQVWPHLLKRSRHAHVGDMIRADPDLFGAFYHFESEGFERKLPLVENLIRKRE